MILFLNFLVIFNAEIIHYKENGSRSTKTLFFNWKRKSTCSGDQSRVKSTWSNFSFNSREALKPLKVITENGDVVCLSKSFTSKITLLNDPKSQIRVQKVENMIKIRVGKRKSDSIRISLIEGSLKLDDSKLEKKNYKAITTEQLLEQNEVKKMLAKHTFPFS